MSDERFVYPNAPQPTSKDYQALREIGIEQVQNLAEKVWTDHNVHDPGITLLEALAYALTDLGNRIDQPIADILASGAPLEGQFPNPVAVLPQRAWTMDDLRRQIIDLPQVRNAWLETVKKPEPGILYLPSQANPPFPPAPPFHFFSGPGEPVHIGGLYEVLIEFETPGDLQEADIYVDINAGVIRMENLPFSYLDEGGQTVDDSLIVEFTFPYWDEEQVQAWQESLTFSSLSDPDGAPDLILRPLPPELAGNDYFLQAEVAHDRGGPDEISVLLKVFTELEAAGARRDAAEAALLQTLESFAIWERYNRMVQVAYQALDSVRETCQANRNLCHDYYRYRAVRVQEIAIEAVAEVVAGTDIEALLGALLWDVTRFLDRPPRFNPFSDQVAQGNLSGEKLLEGPLLQGGWLDEDLLKEDDQHQSRNALYVSDFGAILLEPVGNEATQRIQAIRGLSLSNYVRNRLVTAEARDCLRLVNPGVYQPRFSITKSSISVYRDGQRADYDLEAVINVVEEFRNTANLQARFDPPAFPLPGGRTLDLRSYVPLGEELPQTYGISQAGLPATASVMRKAQKNQLQAYLLPFEQIMADMLAQLSNVPGVFSPEAGSQATYFHQALYNLPAAREILMGASLEETAWQSYLEDVTNPYEQSRREAGESEAVQLERRHAMLDHLLARQGEDMLAYSLQRLTRAASGLTGPASAQARQTTRLSLRDEKAAYLEALPHLQAVRGLGLDLGFSQRGKGMTTSNPENPGSPQYWEVRTYFGRLMMRQPGSAPDAMAAQAAARAALPYGTNPDFYHLVSAGSRFGFELRSSTTPGQGDLLAESVRTHPSQAAALREIQEIVDLLRGAWYTSNRSGLTQRMQYLLGLKGIQRRSLAAPYEDHIRIRTTGGGGFRYDITDLGGRVRFFCPDTFSDEESLMAHVFGLVEASFGPEPFRAVPEGNRFRFNLVAQDETILLVRPGTETNPADTLAWGPLLRDYVYHAFSREGLHLMEHVLLRPHSEQETNLLALYNDRLEPVSDPYTARVTVAFPSGYFREDFSDPEAEPQEDLAPAWYRNPEFRKYAEDTVRKSLPAHIYPHFLWLDRDANASPDPLAPSLNNLEDAWRGFLEASMTHQIDEIALRSAREHMRTVLNRVLEPPIVQALNNLSS